MYRHPPPAPGRAGLRSLEEDAMNETQVMSMYIMYYIIQIDKQDNKKPNEIQSSIQYLFLAAVFVVFAGTLPQHKQVCVGIWVVCAQNMLL